MRGTKAPEKAARERVRAVTPGLSTCPSKGEHHQLKPRQRSRGSWVGTLGAVGAGGSQSGSAAAECANRRCAGLRNT